MAKQLFTFLAFFIAITTNAQPNNQAAEQLHLHLDKDLYLPGETIWFKAYLYNGTNASLISTNLYAALYSSEGKLLQQKQYAIFDGSANGDFLIPDSIDGNSLQLLVFTKGMRLHDSTSSYYRHIPLINTALPSVTATTGEDKIQLQFFAEGGTAVTGITNYYVYKAMHSNGDPAVIKGAITETGSNTLIDSFYTNEQGLGNMQFMPMANKTYQAVWAGQDGRQIITPLPQAATEGAALHAEVTGNTLYYAVTKNNLRPQNFIITISNSQATLYTATVQMKEANKYVGKLPVDSLTTGLIKIVLQDEVKKNLEERMVLINDANKQPLINHTLKDATAKTKNIIEVTLPDTLLCNISASIADINFYNKTCRPGIQNTFWLNGSTTMPATNPLADWLLQAGSYTKYSMNAAPPTDNYLTLSVNYKEKNRALPARERLNLIIKDSIAGNKFYDMQPTTQTSFIKPGLIFYDSAKVFYKTTLTKELENYITLQRDEQPGLPGYIQPVKNITYTAALPVLQNTAALDSFMNGISRKPKKFNEQQTLNTVTVKARKWGSPETRRILELDEKYTTGMFSGIARGFQLNVLDDETAWSQTNICNYIKYRVPGLSGVNCNSDLSSGFPMLFINEINVTPSDLLTINVSQIAYIKFIPGIVIGSGFTTNTGVIYIYLKKGDEPQHSYLPQMRSKMMKGYDLPKQFASPDYTIKENLQQQDRRTTLYWNPYLNTEADKKTIRIEYFNNDISKKLLLIIEGINEEGRLIHIEKIIE